MRTPFAPKFSIFAGCLALAATLTLGTTETAQAQTTSVVEIDSSDRESVNSPDIVDLAAGRFKIVGRSYQVRAVSAGPAAGSVPASRPYYIFPLGSATGRPGAVVAATLTFLHPQISMPRADNNENLDLTETMTFFSVDRVNTQTLRDLREPLINGDPSRPGTPTQSQLDALRRIFDDLGDGIRYGTLTATAANNGDTQTVSLNAAALSALNRAIRTGNADFKIGGDLTSLRGPGNGLERGVQERIFRGADDSGGFGYPEVKLTLTFQDPPPSMSAPVLGGMLGLGLLGTGLGGLGFAARRRKKHS